MFNNELVTVRDQKFSEHYIVEIVSLGRKFNLYNLLNTNDSVKSIKNTEHLLNFSQFPENKKTSTKTVLIGTLANHCQNV